MEEKFEIKNVGEVVVDYVKRTKELFNNGKTFGPWQFTPDDGMIENLDRGYYFYLKDFADSASSLDWIIQISQKNWCSDEELGQLVRLLDEIIQFQSNICGMGIDHKFDWDSFYNEIVNKF